MTRNRHNFDAHNLEQRHHFDGASLDNPRMVPADTPYVNAHVDRAIEAAAVTIGESVLDVGCGLGKFSIPMIDRGFDVSGLDLSADLLGALRHHLGNRSMALYEGDLLDPPVTLHQRFDVVTGFFMLHHVPDLVAAFSGVRRCLRAGGRAVFVEPNAYSPLFPIQIISTPTMSWRADKGVLKMRRGLLSDSLKAAGFTQIEHRWTGLFPPAVTNRVGSNLERRLDRWPLPGPLSSFQVITADAT